MSFVSQNADMSNYKPLNRSRLLRLLGCQQTGTLIPVLGSCLTEEGKDHENELRELVYILLTKALASANSSIPQFPFHCTSRSRESTALVAWHAKWAATPASAELTSQQLNQELFQYAFTEKSDQDCYYSICNGQWESKSSKRHCATCNRCWPSNYSHCNICEKCFIWTGLSHYRSKHGLVQER
jgi:hypothetical protein